MSLIQHNWTKVVRALDVPRRRNELLGMGITAQDLKEATEGGYVKASNALYNVTYKGKKSYSVLSTADLIAHSKALASKTMASPSYTPWVPPKWEPARPGAEDAALIPSRGF